MAAVGIPLGPSTGVGIYNGDRIRISYGDMIRLDAEQRSILLVGGIDGEVTSPSSGLIQKPPVGEASEWRSGNITQRSIA